MSTNIKFTIIAKFNATFFRVGGTYPGAFQTRSFNNEDIMVTLPDGVDACDIGAITVWCQPFRAIFTRLAIPRSTFVRKNCECSPIEMTKVINGFLLCTGKQWK